MRGLRTYSMVSTVSFGPLPKGEELRGGPDTEKLGIHKYVVLSFVTCMPGGCRICQWGGGETDNNHTARGENQWEEWGSAKRRELIMKDGDRGAFYMAGFVSIIPREETRRWRHS